VEQIAQPFIANDVALSPYRQLLLITCNAARDLVLICDSFGTEPIQ
jgi:hypothetical protein